ncbi:MAG: type IV secretory system conjugative DNA transfer family protein [Solirubrobacteraceae bacterium]
MSATSRRSQGPPVDLEVIAGAIAIAVAIGAGFAITLAAHAAAAIDGLHEQIPYSPVALVIDLIKHKLIWPRYATAIAVTTAVLLAGIAAYLWFVIRRLDGHVDRAARWMGRGNAIAPLSEKAVGEKARSFGVDSPGLPIGRSIVGHQLLYADYESVACDIWGPRKGKTSSRAIPTIMAAPGAVLVTSNKRDVVDATRDPRGELGRVWVFDPQAIAGERPSWWWNPLSYVRSERHALELADVFALAARDPGARTDAFFDTAGQNLVAQMLLAAACAKRSLTQAYLWLTRPTDSEPVRVLAQAGYPIVAADLQAQVNAPDKQRGGVFGTALSICAFMVNSEAMEWVTPPSQWRRDRQPKEGETVAQFDPYKFALVAADGSRQTLYSLSKEGKAGAGPLVTGLTMAVCEAAEDIAKRHRAGRLPVPMVAVLDEAANVCRWRKLPDLYSHYGSRGICLMTILQSWSQGVEVWGREGMSKLWSAATVKVYGGGVSEVEFLENVSKLIGDFDLLSRNVSFGGRQGRSTSRSTRREKILDVADLGALPTGRIVVMASGARPTLAKPTPYWQQPYAAAVRASQEAHDPSRDEHRFDDMPHIETPAERAL